MTKRFSLKKVAITLLSALFVLCASFGIVSAKNANTVKADEVVAFQMVDGADLRLDLAHNGLRFAVTVPSDYVEGDTYRMLFAPLDMLDMDELAAGAEKTDKDPGFAPYDYLAYMQHKYPEQELAIAPLTDIFTIDSEEAPDYFEWGKRYFFSTLYVYKCILFFST